MACGSVIDSLRAAADNGQGIIGTTGLSPYEAYLVTVTNDQVSFDQSPAGRTRTNTRLTVGSGFGVSNPHVQYLVKMDTNGVSVLSGGALTEMDLMLGPLVFPYSAGCQAGGTDPALFQPGPSAATNTQVYVWLKGIGLNQANGNYFKVAEVVLNGMDNVFYYVRLVAIEDVIP